MLRGTTEKINTRLRAEAISIEKRVAVALWQLATGNSYRTVSSTFGKYFYSMILQGVVGADGRFLDVATGFPGSIHDARVLRMSGFFGRVQRGEILRGPVRHIDRIPVGPLIAADSAYPGIPWLVKPYQNLPNLEWSNIRFNTILSKARVVVERAFGILKGRWRCLRKELEVDTNNVPKIVVACCILHNICIMMGE